MMMELSSLLLNMPRLELEECIHCKQLPPFGLLPQLDYFKISSAFAVTSIGCEILVAGGSAGERQGGGIAPLCSYFTKLVKLFFINMPNWAEWWWQLEDNQIMLLLPSLKILKIVECPSLRSLPESLLCHATALRDLYIQGAHNLREIQNLLPITKLTLIDNSSLERVSNIPALKLLVVNGCKELQYMEGVDALEHICFNHLPLESVQHMLLDDQEPEFFPLWLMGEGAEQPQFPSLKKLFLKKNLSPRAPWWPVI